MAAPKTAKWIKYRMLLPLISRLPRKTAFWLGTRIGRRFFAHYEREWIENYRSGLITAFPDTDRSQIDHWVYLHFGMMAREELDVFFLTRINQSTIQEMTTLSADVLIHEHNKCGKIIIMAHEGRPIMLSSALGVSGLKIGMLSQVIDERNPHLDSPTRTYLNYKMDHTVRIAGGRWVTTGDDLRILYKALKEGETIIIMLDLVEPDPQRQIKLDFFGGHLKLPPGIIRMAERSGAKLYYGRTIDEDDRVICSVEPLPEDPEMAMQKAAGLLEKDVKTMPWLWWQWNNLPLMWSAE